MLLQILNEKNQGNMFDSRKIQANQSKFNSSYTNFEKKNTPNLIHQIEVSILYSPGCEKRGTGNAFETHLVCKTEKTRLIQKEFSRFKQFSSQRENISRYKVQSSSSDSDFLLSTALP